jgi:anti-sigma B factor antagonist
MMTQHAPIEINVREQNGVRIFDLHGRLTIGDSSDQLTTALATVLQEGARKVIIDLNGVPQIDSSGISTLVRMSVSLGREGGMLHLVCKSGRVLDALTVTRLVEAIPTFDTLAKASKFS